MMERIRRITAVTLIAALMVTALASCKKAEITEEDVYVYVPEYINLPKDIQHMDNPQYFDGKLYFTAHIVTGKDSYTDSYTGEKHEYDITEQRLCSINTDGTGFAELAGYEAEKTPDWLPEGVEGNMYINRIALDTEGNIWISESGSFWYYDLPEDFDESKDEMWQYYVDYGNVNSLRKLDRTGAETATIDLSVITGDSGGGYGVGGGGVIMRPMSASSVRTAPSAGMRDRYFYMSGLNVDNDGNVYVCDGNTSVYVFDSSGVLLFKMDTEDYYPEMLVRLGDGRMAVSLWEGSGRTLKPIDNTARAWGKSIELPMNSYNTYSGDGEFLAFCSDQSNFYGISEDGEQAKLFNFINCDVDINSISGIIPLSDGRIICSSYNYRNNTQTAELIILTKKLASEIEPRIVLGLACIYLDYSIRGEIINFNKTNGKYRIEVREYQEYNTQDDYNAGLTKLTTEIIAGNIPDILDVNQMPIKQYGAKGLLEDLWTYIDADPELGRRNLMENVFKVMEQGGKLYQIGPRFSVFTLMGNSEIVGTKPGWTVDEMFAALAKMPPGADVLDQYVTKDQILMYSCYLGMDEYVDWTTGKCSFDSESFVKVLEFANAFPAEYDWEKIDWEFDYESMPSRIMNGKQMLVMSTFSDFQYIQMYKAMFGDNITFIGFPIQSREGSAISMDGGGLAMSSKCKDKEGAWEFMRIFISEEYQENNSWWGYPTNKKIFDKRLEEAMTPNYYTDPETGEEIEQSKGGWGWDDLQIEIYALKQDEADMILSLINSAKKSFSYDQSMYEIIAEEAAAYFNGQKSARDTAAVIQSRINIYVNEQR